MADSRRSMNVEDELERQHFQRIINAFTYYRQHSLLRVYKSECHFLEMPKHHQKMVPKFLKHLDDLKLAIDHNYQIIKMILKNTDHMFENVNNAMQNGKDEVVSSKIIASSFDMDKVQSTIKQFARDWSEDGKEERQACYQPIINEILEFFPESKCNLEDIHILVPGAGLGRLAFEIARLGYICQGNEWSLFMLFASNFILNNLDRCKGVELYKLHPWIHQYCNNRTDKDQVRYILFPDIDPSDLPSHSQFSMTAGDFQEVYTTHNCWDCVATSFFIDTAHNIISYIETIWNILKPGGLWVNMGPLLYHFADITSESSVELSYEEVKSVIIQTGFLYLKENTNIPNRYAQNPRSLMKYEYECIFFVCKKPHCEES